MANFKHNQLSAIALRALACLVIFGLFWSPAPAAPKVIDLRKFVGWPEWQLDITYHAKDAFEDRDHSAALDMTATAHYVLKRLDRGDGWGHWQALACQSNNLTYKAFWQSKHSLARIDYAAKAGGPMVAPLADLQIGGSTPGYMLIVNGGFPAEMRDSSAGLMDCPLVLGTSEKNQPGLTGVVTGPLPESGDRIHGSRVIPFEISPFLVNMAGMTRMGVEYVLQPVPLAPVTR